MKKKRNPAQQLLAKLNASESAKLFSALNGMSAPRIPASSDTCVVDFVDHLEWLKSRHCPNPYKDEYLVTVVFRKPIYFQSQHVVMAYCKAHLVVALEQLKSLVDDMRGKNSKISASQLSKYKAYLSDYIHDLRLIAQTLERQKDSQYVFIKGGKGYQARSWQTFRASSQLYSLSANPDIRLEHRQAQITSIFVLRQALETKFQRIVGVYISDKSGNTPKLRHDFHYSFIKNNLKYFYFTSVDFMLIEHIYQWCSSIVHNSVQPFPWQVSYALQICEGLFASGHFPDGSGWSMDGGIVINSVELMQEAFAEHFCKTYAHGIWAIKYEEPEAVCNPTWASLWGCCS